MDKLKRPLRLPSPALVIAVIALIVALGGSAYAGVKIGTKQLRKNAVTTSRIKNRAVTSKKIRARAVTHTKIGRSAVETAALDNGSVTTDKLADGSVTTGKLDASAQSQGFVTNQSGQLALPASTDTTVATLSLPAGGHFLVTAATALGSNGLGGLVSCVIQDDGTTVATGYASLDVAAAFSQTVTLTGASDGGSVTLRCNPDNAGQAKSRVITASRVGTLVSQ